MQWLSDLIKHLAISKAFAFAVFVTATTLLFGPQFLPEQIQGLQPEWKNVAMAAMIFSGTYIALWSMRWAWSLVARAKEIFTYFTARNLTEGDQLFLWLIATQRYETLNLCLHDYEPGKITRLEVIHHAKRLSRLGLVRISEHDESIISLTERGKKRAVRILEEKRKTDVDAQQTFRTDT